MNSCRLKLLFAVVALLLAFSAAAFRSTGLFRGLDAHFIFHPDSPKQIRQLDNFLHARYDIWYGNRFYDGYPYGLNRLDEAALRILSPFSRFLAADLSANPAPPPADRTRLFFSARILRCAYGLLALLLLYLAARRWGLSRPLSLAAASLYALAPLAAVVTHSATGDVGVDLFTALALFALASYARTDSLAPLALLGASAGFAFACKFQGALLAFLAVPPFLELLFRRPFPLRRILLAALLLPLSALAAVLVANPSLVLDPPFALRALWNNFGFIKDYGAPPELLALPFSQRLAFGLRENVPFIAACLGPLTLLATVPPALLLLLAALCPAAFRNRLFPGLSGSPRRLASAWALAAYPLLAFFLATAFKLVVQPFHFSALLLPLPLAAAVALAAASPSPAPDAPPSRFRRLLTLHLPALLLLAALVAAVRLDLREAFFWRRPDVSLSALRLSKGVFGHPGYGRKYDPPDDRLKHFSLEPSLLPVFRNTPSSLLPAPGLWPLGLDALPVPSIPLPVPPDPYWIFLGGPRFPRDDRSFVVPASTLPHEWTERGLVFPTPTPTPLHLGIRSGAAPLRLDIRLSGQKPLSLFLPPQSQRILSLPAPRAISSHEATDALSAASVSVLRLRASLGTAYVSLLCSADEIDAFEYFGPSPRPLPDDPLLSNPLSLSRPRARVVQHHVDRLPYLDSDAPLSVPADPASPLPLFDSPLAAGSYVFRASVAFTQPATLTLSIPGTPIVHSLSADAPAVLPLAWSFTKSFAPYDAPLSALASAPGVTILDWNLRPDLLALASDPPPVVAARHNQAPREQAAAYPPVATSPLDLRYPGLATLAAIAFPSDIQAGTPFRFAIQAVLDPCISDHELRNSAIFIHVLDPSGTLVANMDIPLLAATFGDSPDHAQWQLHSLSLPPNSYRLAVGLCRTDHPHYPKFHPKPAPPAPAEKHASPPIPFTLHPSPTP